MHLFETMATSTRSRATQRKQKFVPIVDNANKRKFCSIDDEDDEIIYSEQNNKRVKLTEPIEIFSQEVASQSLIFDEDIGMNNNLNDEVLLDELQEPTGDSDDENITEEYNIPQPNKTFNLISQQFSFAQGELLTVDDSYQSPNTPPMTPATTMVFIPQVHTRYPNTNATNVPLDVSINVRFMEASTVAQCEVRLFLDGERLQGITTRHKNTISFAPSKCLKACQVYQVEVHSSCNGSICKWEFKTKDAGPVNVFLKDCSYNTKRITIQREGIVCLSELLAKASRKFNQELITRVFFDEECMCALDDDDLLTLEDGCVLYIE
jgi:hypothetical protein